MPPANPLRHRLLHTLAALGIALATHGLWALLPLPPPPAPPTAPSVSFTALTTPRPLLASPILFSLPSSLGFSAVALQQRPRILPPLNSPLNLSLPTALPQPEPLSTPASTPLLPPDTLSLPIPHPLPLQTSPTRPPQNRWTLRSPQPLPPSVRLHMFRPPRPPADPQPLHHTGTLAFDQYGQVETLLIDPSSRTPAPDILQALRLVRIPRTAAPLRIPFELHYHPPAQP